MLSNDIKNIAVILGARPNFIKAAPFFREAKNNPKFKFTIIHTGQHFDDNMSKIFFDKMNIPQPDIHLNIAGVYHTEKIGKMFASLKEVLGERKFDAVIVFGDVNSTLAGAIASINNQYKLIHIESGLRSHDRRMPEEINRVIVDHLSDLLFITELSAKYNLINEGIKKDKIKFVGNIMIENIEIYKKNIEQSDILNNLNLKRKEYIVATIHRQENTDDKNNLEIILKILIHISKEYQVIFPLHPGTRQKITDNNFEKFLKKLKVIEPIGYFDFMKLVSEAKGVITDSGGIQEETSFLGIPCCTLRDNTERPITIEKGTNKLFVLDETNINGILMHLNNIYSKIEIPLWDKNVSKRIFNKLVSFFDKI